LIRYGEDERAQGHDDIMPLCAMIRVQQEFEGDFKFEICFFDAEKHHLSQSDRCALKNINRNLGITA
jgi:hypothetical protein